MVTAVSQHQSASVALSFASSRRFAYCLAIAAVAAAVALTLLIRHVTGNPTFFLFYAAIFVSVWFAGRGPGVVATVLCAIALHSFFRHSGDFFVVTGERLPTLLAFITSMIAADILSTQRHRAERALHAARDRLEMAVQERTAELRRANDALAGSELRWRRMYEASFAAMVLFGLDGSFIGANAAFQKMVGYSEDELKKLTAADLSYAEDRPATEKALAEFVADQRHEYHVEKRYLRRDGSTVWFNATTTLVPATDRAPAHLQAILIDITERKRAEAALRASEERWRRLFEASSAGMALMDLDGRCIATNPALQKMYGYTEDELRSVNAMDITHPDDVAATRQALAEFVGGERQEYHVEKRFIRKDGRPLWVNVTTTYLPATDVTPAMLQGVSIDINDRKRAEAALRASEERWRRLFEASSAGMALVDLDARYLATNTAFQNMLGYTDAEFKSMTPFDVTHPDEVATTREIVAEFISGARQEYHVDKRFLRKDGTPVWVNVTTTCLPATDVTPAMLQGIFVNIDDRVRAEAALRDSEARMRAVFAASPVGIARSDENRRLLRANPALQRMLGYSDEELRALGWAALTHEDDRAVSHAWVTDVMEGRRPPPLEKRYLRKDGEILWASVDASFVPATETTPAFMATIIADITDRVRAEEALHRSQSELARVSRITTMGQLAASIAHEINQPLTAIIASGSACERWLANGENQARARQSLARMVAEAERAGEVIKRMRSLTGNTAPERVELDVNEVVREVLALARAELQAKRVRVEANLDGDTPLTRGDRVQLQQVLLNLIVNAIDAMAGVTGWSRVLAIATQPDTDGSVLVTVQDSGVGLAPESAGHIFQPFFTTKPGGMGMGLSISTTIVEAHGGRLWAAPAPVNGTAFHFTLPSAR